MDAILITAYCDTDEKKMTLYKLLSQLRNNFFICLATHSIVSENILELCDLVIYDRNNEVDFSKGLTHGVAEMMLVEQGFNLLEYYGYDRCYKIPFDCDIEEISVFESWKKNDNFVSAWWNRNSREISTFCWYGSIKYILKNFKFYKKVSDMIQDGYNIEKCWGLKYESVKNDIYLYDNVNAMFGENNKINLYTH